MEVGIDAARWVVGKALGPASGGVLEAWAASSELGTNIRALRMELLYAQGMLNNARGHGRRRDEIHNPALAELLQELRDLAYSADDALDEVDYFRIQDELDGTYHAADQHAGGCLRNHALNARHTVKGIGKMLGFSSCSRPAASRDEADEDKRGFCCGAWPCRGDTTPAGDEQEEEGASRRVMCGVAWPCGGQSTSQMESSQQPSNKADQEEVHNHSGCMQRLASGARNTISIAGKHLPFCSVPSPVQNDANSNMASSGSGGRFFCCTRPNKAPQREHSVKEPKLKFDRVEMSKRMKEITEQLKPLCAKVSTILNLDMLESNRSISQCIATSLDAVLSKKQGHTPLLTNSAAMVSRPITTAELQEPKIYGREDKIRDIIHVITKSDYCDKDLTVLPIVGPGGIGKTTLTQHIYKELKHHFEEKIWVCVSTTFSVYRLTQEIADNLNIVKKGNNVEKLIEEGLKSKKFLLVLDDIWSCTNDEWGRVLALFTKGQTKGSIILVTSRFPAVAQRVKTTDQWIDLVGLETEAFKALFLAYVFGDKQPSNDHRGLVDIGFKIVDKLKGSPLAAKTVGRLLSKHLDSDHWNRVLESKEWESENGEQDIMPALKLSYDYLPFHLQQCFIYCALFPEDYKFKREELIHLWIGLDVLHSHGKNKRIEDIGQDHLEDLVNFGFFKREGDDENACYLTHDLLHELALKVSSQECLSICSSTARSIKIPPSIRHLSINIDDTSVKDRMTFRACQKDLSALVKRLKVENLRSLMLFGRHQHSFVKTFAGLLKDAKALHVIFLSEASYNVEDVLQNFSKCLHLRYLRIVCKYDSIRLPNIISRFYHLTVLDLGECYVLYNSSRDMSNLGKLRHFIAVQRESKIAVQRESKHLHSEIFEVGKLKSLQGLREFKVKKEIQGFELNQIGHLVELCGSLSIYNLEKVEADEEADEAKLTQKPYLRRLTLHWNSGQPNKGSAREEQVLERLKPSDNLIELCIRGHGGTTCPSWLGADLSVKDLEFLHLDDVSWKRLPPLGELSLVDEQDKECCQSYIGGQRFRKLKKLVLVKIPKLKKWVGNGRCELFSHLEALIIEDCPELMELPFTHHTGCETEHGDHMSWFPKLEELQITDCPKLSSLPCIPWSSTTCSARIAEVGSGLEHLDYGEGFNSSEYRLKIKGKDALDSTLWTAVAFHNLSELRKLDVTRCPPLSLDHLQMLSSLKTLEICDSGTAVWLPEGDDCVGYQFPVEDITIQQFGGSGERLTRLLSYFPKLRSFTVRECEKLTGLGVVNNQQEETEAPTQPLSSSINRVKEAQIEQCEQQQQQDTREEEIAAAAAAAATSEGLLLLPPQLQDLQIEDCQNLVLWCPGLLDNDEDAGRTAGGGGGLQGLTSLRSLCIEDCPRILSAYSSSSSSPCFPFPASLEDLGLVGALGTETPLPLSNLTSLTDLFSWGCGGLRADGLRSLLAQGRLTRLSVRRTPSFFAGSDSEPSPPHEEESPSSSSRLQVLSTDDTAGALAAPMWNLLSSSLTNLTFWGDKEMERFTEEHEEALRFLTSLETIRFLYCDKLQSLPAGMHRLPKLKELDIRGCAAIRSLPKDGLPRSLQRLEIFNCPAIRSLPKVDDLPISLRVLDVRGSDNSEELRRQCRKLIGTIPIVYD